ncbi:hypothetical protein PJO11_001235 [Campylobacter coli]|nr:hypothetical protein [Campylobacter coli]EKJ6089012.1 hypothetical protein [Campylobacter coli]
MTTKKQRKLCIENLVSSGVYAYEHDGLVVVSIDEIDQSFILHDEEVIARAKKCED